MLKLDEKKIRKGKPVGLPYVGRKRLVKRLHKSSHKTLAPINQYMTCLVVGVRFHWN